MKSYGGLLFASFTCAAAVSFFATPLVRLLALRFGPLDAPTSSVKTHKEPTPVFGGVSIWLGFMSTMLLLRLMTTFPTGTLYNLRALMLGGTLVFVLGLIDDMKRPEGVDYKPKFVVQILAALLLIAFGLRMRFISPAYVAAAVTVVWVVGVTNAFNIVDIMDGLSASQAAVAALGFMMIALPSEELYVNFASAALAGAAAGFLPWNLSKKHKIFMGDCGSLLLGFTLAGISLGTRYSDVNDAGVFAPLLILFVPAFDTFFVSLLRLNQGKSPFLGSKDHFALRLEKMGHPRGRVVVMAAAAAAFLGFCAFLVTQLPLKSAVAVYVIVASLVFWVGRKMALVEMR
ncbi:MAG: undecaprenyl/decaprenyl-phosphate alpha-N-acetylglucosaminyl 1-phosphate transferase [Elusimicrobiota bacterium]|nr:MAG: undecaprenyl/decaprenyl-phosphate alpha-N-acetylglucosaminyl 1-phosphate transferase [Elusimicrobiota bacterium]